MDLSQIHLHQSKTSAKYPKIQQCLFNMLALTPLIIEFKAPHDIASLIHEGILKKLFLELPSLKVLELRNCSSPAFAEAFISIMNQLPNANFLPFTSLSISNAFVMPETLQGLIPRLGFISSLSIAGTNITAAALHKLPRTARIQHLDVSSCPLLDRAELVVFTLSHPAARLSLTSLDASTSAGSTVSNPVFDAMDTAKFLREGPETLTHVRLCGWPMNSTCINLLKDRAAVIEQLAIGTSLTMRDLEMLFLDHAGAESHPREVERLEGDTIGQEEKSSSMLKTIRTAVAICKLRRRLNDVPLPGTPQSSLKYLDLRSMALDEQCLIGESVLLGHHSGALRAVEICEEVFGGEDREVLSRAIESVGWKVEGGNRRVLLVRARPFE